MASAAITMTNELDDKYSINEFAMFSLQDTVTGILQEYLYIKEFSKLEIKVRVLMI